eukprot:353222-Chlamydomonas_euryale.AAC.6
MPVRGLPLNSNLTLPQVFMDMAVQRCGDVAAAAMFQMLRECPAKGSCVPAPEQTPLSESPASVPPRMSRMSGWASLSALSQPSALGCARTKRAAAQPTRLTVAYKLIKAPRRPYKETV